MNFCCPDCHSLLNPKGEVVLLGERGDSRGLFVFDPRPGADIYSADSGLDIEPGEIWNFSCPVCRRDITTHFNERLAHILMEDEGEDFIVIFSKIANEHATFVLSREKLESFGDSFDEYLEQGLNHQFW